MNTKPGRIHPLFDDTSPYRAATERSIFGQDHGRKRFAEFFRALLQSHRLDQSLADPSNHAPPHELGLAGVSDNDLVEFLKHTRRSQKPLDEQNTSVTAGLRRGRAPDERTTRIQRLVFNVDTGAVPVALSRPARDAGTFETAVGLRRTPSSCVFVANLTHIPDRRRCLILILTDPVITMLGDILHKSVDTDDERASVISEALASMRRASQTAGDAVDRLAFRVSMVIAAAPALELVSDQGKIHIAVELDRATPDVPGDSCVVICIGPPAPRPPTPR